MNAPMRLIFAILLSCIAQGADAGTKQNYPFEGYFSQQFADAPEGYKQANCAFAFFRQLPDGRVMDYVLDVPLYEKSGEIKYRLEMSSQCEYDEASKTDVCTRTFTGGNPAVPLQSFEYIDASNVDEPLLYTFSSKPQFDTFMRLRASLPDKAKLPPIHADFIHRCAGFSDEVIAPHLEGQADPGLTAIQPLGPAFNPKNIQLALRIMEALGSAAFNATLPGQ